MVNYCQCGERVTCYLTKLLKLVIDDSLWSHQVTPDLFTCEITSVLNTCICISSQLMLMSDCH